MTALRRLVALALATCLLALAACSAVPEQLRATIKDLPEQIKNSRKAVDEAEEAYAEKIKDGKYDFTREYTPEQMRTTRFATARSNLDEATAVYEGQVKPLEKDFKEEQLDALQTQVERVRSLIKDSDRNAKEPARWADYLVTVKNDRAKIVATANSSTAAINKVYDALKIDADKATKDFVAQQAKITEKMAPFIKLHDDSNVALETVQAENKKSAPFYPTMAEAADLIRVNEETINKTAPVLTADFRGLYVRETHTLIDIRVDSVLYLGRTSWNESVDGGEQDFEFPGIAVDTSTADYFAQFPADTVLATYNSGWGGGFKLTLSQGVDQAKWDALRLDPGQSWPSKYHGSSEIWMDALEDTYCHKLKVFKNGKPDASDRPKTGDDDACLKYNTQADIDNGIYWEEADELLAEAIGMDIYAKAYGDFADQAIESATPPGLVYVNDPAAGEWRTDSTGQSFWYYYGMYRFFDDLIGGPYPYYYRSEYDRWNRDYRRSGKPYYMPNSSGTPRFGGKSPQTQSRFPNSNYNKSGLRDATVRNSGPVSRSGGPGGGGK